ncbi:hypothetical protein VXN68_04160 [Acinetobacter schindleri]|uniref:hypothetical protein n=1 Tax=Acinetobacter schindleri TaxID=108981 RepID=UPI003A8B3063
MIKTPLSTVIGGAFWTPGATVINGAKLSFEIVMKKLFANGEQGFWYDPNDLSTMFQDARIIPLTGATQPIGVMLDKSKGLVEGAEIFEKIDFTASGGWTTSGFVAERSLKQFTTTGTGGLAFRVGRGKSYRLSMKGHSTAAFRIRNTSSSASGIDIIPAGGFDIDAYPVAMLLDNDYFFLQLQATGVFTLEHLSLKEISGNHAYQTTSASRPILQDAPRRIDFDTVDDKLITNLPAQLTGCTVIRAVPSVGVQLLTNQTIPATYEDNKDHCGLIVINRALTPSETSAIEKELAKRTGVTLNV